MTCPVCSQPRTGHADGCDYERTLDAALGRFAAARADFGRALRKALRLPPRRS